MHRYAALVFVLAVGLTSAASVEKLSRNVRDTGGSHAAAAPAPASYEGGSQGNLYYYYYPVESYGASGVEDSGFDIFTAIILPLLILGGVLLALSSLSFSINGGRNLQEDDVMVKLETEIEKAFYIYLNAFKSEQCIQRTVCQTGVYAKNLKFKEFFLRLVKQS